MVKSGWEPHWQGASKDQLNNNNNQKLIDRVHKIIGKSPLITDARRLPSVLSPCFAVVWQHLLTYHVMFYLIFLWIDHMSLDCRWFKSCWFKLGWGHPIIMCDEAFPYNFISTQDLDALFTTDKIVKHLLPFEFKGKLLYMKHKNSYLSCKCLIFFFYQSTIYKKYEWYFFYQGNEGAINI